MITVKAPSSKSISHRFIMAAALASGVSMIESVLESKDLERTRAILRLAGAEIVRQSPGIYKVQGVAGKPRGGETAPLSCDAHESGTTCRLLTAILAAGSGKFYIYGAPRLHDRPVGELTVTLQRLGVTVNFAGKPGYPPLTLNTKGFYPPADGTPVSISLGESSQYLSGLLLAAPMAKAALVLEIGGEKIVSWPYIGLTLQTLELFGIPFAVETRDDHEAAWSHADWRTIREVHPGCIRFLMQPATYQSGHYITEGDWSGASCFLAAGAAGREAVRVEGLHASSLQGDRAMLSILKQMGADVETESDAVIVSPSPLHGIAIDMSACPDLVPTVAVLAAFAQGETRIRNVAHLRIKESDRLAAPARELARIGVSCQEHLDGLDITGLGHPPLYTEDISSRNLRFCTYGDHRMAMSLALLETHGYRTEMDDPACVAKSFPNFWQEWRKIC